MLGRHASEPKFETQKWKDDKKNKRSLFKANGSIFDWFYHTFSCTGTQKTGKEILTFLCYYVLTRCFMLGWFGKWYRLINHMLWQVERKLLGLYTLVLWMHTVYFIFLFLVNLIIKYYFRENSFEIIYINFLIYN